MDMQSGQETPSFHLKYLSTGNLNRFGWHYIIGLLERCYIRGTIWRRWRISLYSILHCELVKKTFKFINKWFSKSQIKSYVQQWCCMDTSLSLKQWVIEYLKKISVYQKRRLTLIALLIVDATASHLLLSVWGPGEVYQNAHRFDSFTDLYNYIKNHVQIFDEWLNHVIKDHCKGHVTHHITPNDAQNNKIICTLV